MQLFAIASVLYLVAAAAEVPGNGLVTVRTQQGDVVGTRVSSGVRRWLGIPFAVAERWGAPQLPPRREKPFSAHNFGPSCPQAFSRSLDAFFNATGSDPRQRQVAESEDCLSVNIWAPSTTRKQKTAVMIWVYGGAFQIGSSNTPTFDGQTLVHAHDDVTVVSFNYRLNILGQPNAPQLYNQSQSQNFGLLDVDAAVQWVYDNIAEFGGDPERMVLFGESAGGVTVDAYTYAHPQDRRIKGVIEQSGNLGLPVTGAAGGTFSPDAWNAVANDVGCGSGSAQFVCMKNVNHTALIAAVVKNNLSFNPVADGITIFSDTRTRAEAGNFLRVPLLTGNTAHEMDVFIVAGQLSSLGYTIPVLTELLSDLLQASIACPVAQTANDRVKAAVPSWRYVYHGVFRDISPRPDLRAYHSSEIPLVFGTTTTTTTSTSSNGSSTEERALSKYMQGAWIAFARDPENGLTYYGWPAYNPRTVSIAELGGFYEKTGVVFAKAEIVDFICGVTDTLNAAFGQLAAVLVQAGGSIS